jgi:hypothetical protein
MALPMLPNTTCDIYRTGTGPPNAPAVSKQQFFLLPKGASSLTTPQYTHKGYFASTVDIRDDYQGLTGWMQGATPAAQPSSDPAFTLINITEYIDWTSDFMAGLNCDTICVPYHTASVYTLFWVLLVRRLAQGTAADCYEVLLQRVAGTTWPNNNL